MWRRGRGGREDQEDETAIAKPKQPTRRCLNVLCVRKHESHLPRLFVKARMAVLTVPTRGCVANMRFVTMYNICFVLVLCVRADVLPFVNRAELTHTNSDRGS